MSDVHPLLVSLGMHMKSIMRSVFLITLVCSVLVMLLKNSLSVSATSLWSLISLYLVIVFENNMIIVLLLARIDKRSNSAPKLPLISEFFFAEFCKIFLHSSSSDAHNFISHDNSLYSPHWVLQECTGPRVAGASLGRPVNLCVGNV